MNLPSRRTMVRAVLDPFQALQMCNAMEAHGGEVHSVVCGPNGGAWYVFAVIHESAFTAVDQTFKELVGSL